MDDDRDEEAQLHKQTELLEQFESLYKVQLVNFQINPIKIGLWLHVITWTCHQAGPYGWDNCMQMHLFFIMDGIFIFWDKLCFINLLEYLYYTFVLTSSPQTAGDWKEESTDVCEFVRMETGTVFCW